MTTYATGRLQGASHRKTGMPAWRHFRAAGTLCLSALLIVAVGCAGDAALPTQTASTATPQPAPPALPSKLTEVSVEQEDLADASSTCEGTFVAHDLDHVIMIEGDVIHQYDANGAGLGINDLDNDGDLDIVLANLDGSNAIFWNEGGLTFRKEEFPHGDSRGVSIVDVDGDGWQDVAFSRRGRVPLDLWRNNGVTDPPGFTHDDEFGVRFGYSMSWGDLDVDDDLDLVIGAYDIELVRGDRPDENVGGGVVHYENQEGKFAPSLMAYESQALTIFFTDINEDGRLDVLVGNDFEVPDDTWLRQGDSWHKVQPFVETSENTMSISSADIDNDGHFELLTTDMMPYAQDVETSAAWEPLMKVMHETEHREDDPQVMANMLQVRDELGQFENRAEYSGVAASGWSWSTKFGDLDNDGLVDIYSVNGMYGVELFGHLPDSELVEENQVYRNSGKGQFVPVSDWGLNATASGRGMSLGDLDGDGDLDIVVNNVLSPSQVLENRLCGGSGLEIDLFQPGGGNTRAIGAKLILYTDTTTMYREVRAASGYLSGDAARIHFGFPEGSHLMRLDIRWPDGAVSSVEEPTAQTLLSISRER